MAEYSGFFNAILTDGEYDRKYNANDYSDNLANVISNGVLRTSTDALRVTASGMVLTVAPGRGWIDGHYYKNDANYTFAAIVAPTQYSRYDAVVLELNTNISERQIKLKYVTGTAALTPVKPTPTRSGDVYQLILAYVHIEANATSVTLEDVRGDNTVCGWVYSTSGDNSFFTSLDNQFNTWFQAKKNTLSSVTLFKRYNWRTVLAAQSNTVTFSVPQYDANTCFIEVYVNGILETLNVDYTQSGSILTFSGTLTAGTEVEVKVFKSIDGTGITTVADEITQLQNQVAALTGVSRFTYKCTGSNDNITLSQIAQAIYQGSYTASDVTAAADAFLTALGGNTYLAGLASDAQITIDVTGHLGATTPYAGSGSAASRYRWFSFGLATVDYKVLTFDFSKCDKINITCAANSNNIIFFGTDLNIIGANVAATSQAASCIITMATGGNVFGVQNYDNCRFSVITTGKAVISNNGTFTNCILHVKSATDNGYAIDGDSSAAIRLTNCKLFAYTGASASKVGSCFNTDSGKSAAIMAYNTYAPVIAQTGYTQTYLGRAFAGMIYINGVITPLNMNGNAANYTLNGKIS